MRVNAPRLVIATAGVDKVMLGTDYLFPIGDWERTAIVRAPNKHSSVTVPGALQPAVRRRGG